MHMDRNCALAGYAPNVMSGSHQCHLNDKMEKIMLPPAHPFVALQRLGIKIDIALNQCCRLKVTSSTFQWYILFFNCEKKLLSQWSLVCDPWWRRAKNKLFTTHVYYAISVNYNCIMLLPGWCALGHKCMNYLIRAE